MKAVFGSFSLSFCENEMCLQYDSSTFDIYIFMRTCDPYLPCMKMQFFRPLKIAYFERPENVNFCDYADAITLLKKRLMPKVEESFYKELLFSRKHERS